MVNRKEDDQSVNFKAVSIFETMRANLALATSFLRRSYAERENFDNQVDLGFLGLPQGELQTQTHNQAILTIATALVSQVLQNYLDLKNILGRLEDQDIELFLDQKGSRDEFIEGIDAIRNSTFHVALTSREQKLDKVTALINQGEGTLVTVSELLRLFYEFTSKVFRGELKIWPDSIYENQQRLEIERPDLLRKLEAGEIEFDEIVQFLNS